MRDFHLPGRSSVFSCEGMCATSHPLAAQTALDILKRGGNAMDAAISGAVLLGLCEPAMTGIGGDCFVLYTDPNSGKIKSLNGSGRAPAASSAEFLRAEGHKKVPTEGAHAVTIPGAIDAFCYLSETTGKLGLDTLLAPAIHYAESGIPAAPRVAFDWEDKAGTLQGAARAHFLNDGAPLRTGDLFRAPGQAEVLRRVAKQGRDGFYSGEVAEDMVNSLVKAGGCHAMSDFAETRCEETTPIISTYGNTELIEHPPNGQGATASLLLNILSHFDVAALDPFGAARTHLETEAAKLAYDARNRIIADAEYTTRLKYMLSAELASSLAGLINPKTVITNTATLTESVHKDTVYITVVDRDRMAVSLIYSIFKGFGSGLASDKFGILFQNRGAGFTLERGHPNEMGGRKRPMHTIIPGMLRTNNCLTPFGVMGGSYQPTGHARFVTNMYDYGLSMQASIDAPRAFSDEGKLNIERGYPEHVYGELSELGHQINIPKVPIGGAQAIRIHENGVLEGASDHRKDGCAIGF